MSKKTMTTKYIIVDIVNKKFFLDVNGNVLIFNTFDSAVFHCGIYELPNAWVCHLMYNYIENE
jgi:hypothetical protein